MAGGVAESCWKASLVENRREAHLLSRLERHCPVPNICSLGTQAEGKVPYSLLRKELELRKAV